MLKLNRIILFGNNIAGLKDFYQSNFKLELIEEIENEWVVLKAGQIELAFHSIGAEYRSEKDFKVASNVKLVFTLTEGLSDFRDKLITKGIMMKEIKSFKGIDFLFCDGEDIEGNVFQLSQKKL
ncbi:VOC family protein [Pedobacter namyangjuensis]|uniref:VOC family protein n=1 Tax=Pedobacter namyangjuensis TaxID=600626 RepID=UPI000DE366E3|nr:VOC family protein [Pedobacter namyangjuensis]